MARITSLCQLNALIRNNLHAFLTTCSIIQHFIHSFQFCDVFYRSLFSSTAFFFYMMTECSNCGCVVSVY